MDSTHFDIVDEIKSEYLADEEIHTLDDQGDSKTFVIKSENEQFCNYSEKLEFEIKPDQDDNSQEMHEKIQDCKVKHDVDMLIVPSDHNYCRIITNDQEMYSIHQETKHTVENCDIVKATISNFSGLYEGNSLNAIQIEVVADVYQQQTQQQSQRNIQSKQKRPYSNAERQRRYREKRKADKVYTCSTFSQSSNIQPQNDIEMNKRQPQSNAERQKRYRKSLREKQQQQRQSEHINATVLSNTQHTSSIHQLKKVDEAKQARKRLLNKQRQSRFRARQRFKSPSTSSHQAWTESETAT